MTKMQHRIYIGVLFLLGFTATVYLAIFGFNYYTTSIEERFFNPSHQLLRPSGLIGHGLGILGSLMMLAGVVLYMVRKRVRRFSRIGILKYWLEFHIFLCSVGPILVLYHTAFKFGGIVAVSFWSMVAVVLSGVVGRFIYVQIPRTIQGHELSFEELRNLNSSLSSNLKESFHLEESFLLELDEFAFPAKDKIKSGGSLFLFVAEYFKNKRFLHSVKKYLTEKKISKKDLKEIVKICKSKIVLSRRIEMLRSMQKLFKYWHIVHLPFAILMLLIMIVHVMVTIVFGYKWIF